MLGRIISFVKAAYVVRKMRGGFDPMDLWWMGGMVLIAFLLLWYVLSVVIPDLHIWW